MHFQANWLEPFPFPVSIRSQLRYLGQTQSQMLLHPTWLLYPQFEQDFEKPAKLLDSASVQPFVYQLAPSFGGLRFAPSPERIRLDFASVT